MAQHSGGRAEHDDDVTDERRGHESHAEPARDFVRFVTVHDVERSTGPGPLEPSGLGPLGNALLATVHLYPQRRAGDA